MNIKVVANNAGIFAKVILAVQTIKHHCNKGGISNGALISRIINGKHNIQINNIYKVCKGLSCDSKDILPF